MHAYIKNAQELFNEDRNFYINIINECKSIIDNESVGDYNRSLTKKGNSSVEAPIFFNFIGQFQKKYLPVTNLIDNEYTNLKNKVENGFKDVIDKLFISGEDSKKNLEIVSEYKANFVEFGMSDIIYYTNHLFAETGKYVDKINNIKEIRKYICRYFKSEDVNPQDLYSIGSVFFAITDEELGYEDFRCFLSKIDSTSIHAIEDARFIGISSLANKGDLAAIEILKGLGKVNVKYAENTIRNTNIIENS